MAPKVAKTSCCSGELRSVDPEGQDPVSLPVDATGIGKEGAVKGMVAKWTYTFNFGGFFYETEGYIQSN